MERNQILLDNDTWAEHLYRSKFNLKKLNNIFKIQFFYKEFINEIIKIFDGKSQMNKKNFYFSEVKVEFINLVKQTKFQRYGHLLLKAVAIIEKNSLKFSGLPQYTLFSFNCLDLLASFTKNRYGKRSQQSF
jgi:hypothetical protein